MKRTLRFQFKRCSIAVFRNTTTAAPVTSATSSSTSAPNTTTATTTTTTTSMTRRASTTTTVLVIPPSIHPLVKHCKAIVVRNISWPDTAASVVAVRPCPNNEEGEWQLSFIILISVVIANQNFAFKPVECRI